MIKNVKLGSDAEVFLRDLAGHPFPVCGLIGGTKESPKPAKGMGPGFAVQEDNAAYEFNIPAAKDPHTFHHNFSAMRHYIQNSLPAGLWPDYELASCEFHKAYLDIPQMNVFGCEPDINAYSKTTNDRPRPFSPGFRTASAHIHISWDNPTDEERLELVRLGDVFVVLPGLQAENKSEQMRRKMYGKAGAFRWKEYGVEHRVKSNRWINGDAYNVWEQYNHAIAAYNHGIRVDDEDYPKIQAAINEHHLKLAGSLYDKYCTKTQQVAYVDF